ncbi:restriction endonuclease subunit R [Helicobacter pylori]|uniref:type I restriction endonuclease n=1 Tax=Helicobacter pylori TaxID=210 RepID=UPI000BE865A5|nr:type I restriction endonuclease subunit R [Helicobacter pylori]PDX01537.1 restriction endonuclease subunit R [Helicobacter pylori]WQU71445.1 type I restriction endonuclease subunit R [Helicobacter pylori]
MPYNEITRVQIPALMHLAKLGYDFIPAKNKPNLDTATNILTDSFTQSFERLNPNPTKNAQDALTEMKKRLSYDDLGKSFYEYLLKSENQIIDFDNPNNNLYEMMAELPYKSFRPDITLFINGLPLVNIEVKQPYAKKGIKEERDRHIQRYKNPENNIFYNLAQIWLFSDNLPYDENNPNQGVFYSASYSPIFQHFVEANKLDITPPPENEQNYQNHRSLEEIQKRVLNEFNLKDTDTLESPKDTPTNPLLTSFCSHKRLCFILKYGISFLKEKSEFKKHIWRYAQMFASLNVLKELQKHYETNPKDPLKGIIWHTQGSGKTALTYHLTKLIRDFFSPLNKKTKFYFIVDRLDLLEQAKNEFLKRGLCVHEAENKEDLSQKLKNASVFEGPQGNDEIIVVNIQKFKAPNEEKAPNEDPSSAPKEIVSKTELQEATKDSHDLQRVFIIDEAHRSYDPKGCFYANLIECDKTAVKIALTGTPLLENNAQDKATKKTFGNYLHTYSYAESIKDRHTLKLQLEIIEKSYKEKLQAIYRLLQESITIEDIEVKKETILNNEKYIKEMLFYIIRDLLKFRQLHDDNEQLKAMVVCFSSAQAKLANCLFNEVQEKVLQENPNLKILKQLQSSLILHDEQEVKDKIYSFKHEDTDIVFVFNMLLTGFDLPNLKRLYIHRELKDHNLLQALARVNRPYNNMSFGYLIDFVGIQENFDKTTDDYLKELNRFNQSNASSDSNLKDMFADRKVLEKDIKNAYDDLFNYPIDDMEGMTSAIVNISAMNELLKVSQAINTLKERYNLIRTSSDEKILSLKEKMDIEKINKISSMLHKKAKHLHALKNINEPKNPNDLMILEDLIALLDFKIEFKESKELHFKEKEEISAKYKQAKEILEKSPDKQDKEIQKIYKELSKLLQEPLTNHNFDGISHSYDAIISQLKQHKEQTTNLLSKYNNDRAYVITHKRLHERLMEQNVSKGIFTLLSALKKAIDARISKRQEILNEETTLKNAIKAELRDAFKENPSLKDLEKEKEFITQTLFNELTQNHHQGNSHA